MVPDELKAVFEGVVEGRLGRRAWAEFLKQNPERPRLDNLHLVSKIRKIPLEVMIDLPPLLCKLAFLRPQATLETWDKIAASWQAGWDTPLAEVEHEVRPLPPALWELFWENLEAPEIAKIVEISPRYATYLDGWQRENYAEAMLNRPGIDLTARLNFPDPAYTLEGLSGCSEGSFARAFYHHLVDNNLKLDLLEPSNYNWLNPDTKFIGKRTLQTYDFWHVALGYGVTGGEELALQAVTLAQTGSAFPAYLLSMLITRNLFFSPSQMPYILDLLLKGWQHGRRNPPLLPLAWEEMWDVPLEEVREKYGLVAANASGPVKY